MGRFNKSIHSRSTEIEHYFTDNTTNESHRICKHIIKAPRANAKNLSFVKELSKPSQERKEIFKNAPPHGEKDKMKDRKTETLTDMKRKHETLTGGCCQWRDSGSYDRDVHIETLFLRGKFCGEIATEQQPPNRYTQGNN